MTIQDLVDSSMLEEAPESGWMLAYLRQTVVFHSYQTIAETIEELKDGELLELHLFSARKEYRAVVSSSKRYENGFVEHTANFPMDKESVYVENVLTERTLHAAVDRISVLNHFSFDENGMLQIDDYRLVAGE